MEVGAARGLSLALLVMMMMILLKTSSCRASISSLNNDSYTGSGLIADDLETQFLMDSDFSRILGSTSNKISPGTLKPNPAACGRNNGPKSYGSGCTTLPNKIKKKENCVPGSSDTFNRVCSQFR
ncbi:hypothetical protein ACB094_06G105700 [Castanea mollissima]